MEPVRIGEWVGAVSEGAPVNFRNIFFNPHGHCTHTESVGHIAREIHSVNRVVKRFFFPATLLTVTPEKDGDDRVITRKLMERTGTGHFLEGLVIRTLPNDESKAKRHYSGTNPPFLDQEAAAWMCASGVQHLLVDLPSVDKERDDGRLAAHHAFWNFPDAPRMDCTITELVYIPDHIPDGRYFLELQFAAFENDAAPSRPVLYAIDS